MINLLTPERQQELLAEYRQRRRVVASWLALGGFALALALLAVLFFQLHATQGEVATALAKVSAQLSPENELALKEAGRTLAIARSGARAPLTAWWEVVLAARPAGLTITDWQWQASEASAPARVSLAGRAGKRQQLLDFIARLKQEKLFSAVESPISNLIKNRNINFTIELTLKPNEK